MNEYPLEQIAALARGLSPVDKVRLVEQIMATLGQELQNIPSSHSSRSLLGIWSDANVSAEEISEARHEIWSNFPREDIG